MKYLGGTFSVPMSGDQKYRDNWEATFGKKKAPEVAPGPCEGYKGYPWTTCGCKVCRERYETDAFLVRNASGRQPGDDGDGD